MNRGEMDAPTFNLGVDRVASAGELNEIAITQDVKAFQTPSWKVPLDFT